ncbi:helix-turn-helix domain-containing protein, partial [Nostoc sp. NIES-2111]
LELTSLQNQEQPTPKSLTLLLNKSESLPQTENLSSGSNIPAGSFDKVEQANKQPQKKFNSVEDLLNQVLLDPGIMASESLPAVYKNEIKLRAWRFPWRTLTRDKVYQTCDRRLVELIAKERAEWDKTNWQQKIPTVLKSIGLCENSKVGLEQLLGYWSQVVKSQNSANPDSKANDEPIGYYSSRSLDWHKGTFNELLDLADRIGQENAIAQFTTRYDQQHTGATANWLNWLEANHPKMYTYLHKQAA